MVAPTVQSAHALPRFLLPRLSWQGPSQLSRCLVAPSHLQQPQPLQRKPWQPVQTAGFHAARLTGSVSASQPRRSAILRHPVLQRSFHATAPRARDHHFDTLKFVQRLQSEGFTEDQSVAMMKVLNDVIEER